ncbi:MAG TPA: ABC transporter substrate-binding protein [Methylomirabilota bacterium]|nr:ABC transporter substrate-binding protein [Methylomirabilota bacterium]
MTRPLPARTVGVTAALTFALVLTLPALAQPVARTYRIGWLSTFSHPMLEPFREGLRAHGYVEGQNLVIEQRYADGKLERLPSLADQLVLLRLDVLVVSGRATTMAARDHASRVPIVFVTGDPVADGVVTNLARPGGNMTGMALMTHEIAAKWVELARDALGASRIGIVADPGGGKAQRLSAEQAARQLGLEWHILEVGTEDGIERAFQAAARRRVQALIFLSSPFFARERSRLVGAAARHRQPVIYEHRDFVDSGGLMSYGPNVRDVFRRAAAQVDKILKGAQAGDLPVEQPTKLELVINLKAARPLGLTFPQSVLVRADAVLQ